MEEKKYWHELSKDERNQLYDKHITVGEIMENYKQPNWCKCPDALGIKRGCWSLMFCSEMINEEFCKSCDGYNNIEK